MTAQDFWSLLSSGVLLILSVVSCLQALRIKKMEGIVNTLSFCLTHFDIKTKPAKGVASIERLENDLEKEILKALEAHLVEAKVKVGVINFGMAQSGAPPPTRPPSVDTNAMPLGPKISAKLAEEDAKNRDGFTYGEFLDGLELDRVIAETDSEWPKTGRPGKPDDDMTFEGPAFFVSNNGEKGVIR